LVLPTIAQALGVTETGHQPLRESLITNLRDKQLLLLLDNVEHLLPAIPLVADLLVACAQLKVLATSRAALRVRGEREVVVPLLPEAAPDLPPRQRTLRDTIAWSHDLLEPGEQALFARLGVFRGGWTLDAAEAVCRVPGEIPGAVLEGLTALVHQSLVQVEGA